MASLLLGALPVTPQSRISASKSEITGTSVKFSPSSVSFCTVSSASIPFVYCGRGDKKTAKESDSTIPLEMPRNKKKGRGPPRVAVPPAPPRKDKFDNDEKIHIEIDESDFSN